MCKGTSNWEDVYIVPNKIIPQNIRKTLNQGRLENYGGIPVDKCIGKEVEYLITKGINTLGSCCGHGEYKSHVLVYEEEIPKVIELGYEYEEFRWNMYYVYLKSGTQM